ncbi:hypothetical protein [Parvularcula dongshanensis]|uniref:Uncharacterized protein n=1 Tax=Parvularcula dongshanensis TaxID=1173995 RepID=A0A840I4V6_9PROT|nr:hypothetical protein [Parvularcula dongshanensis]MBB4659817.1 hypothetical protein [Parvularcula dongshanensis]
MQITQDDLAALHHLRAHWAGGPDAARSSETLAHYPGRAEGRVAAWAYGRTVKALSRHARRRLHIGEGLVPSADERAVLRIARLLGQRDWTGAESAAAWVVRRDGVAPLLDALAPAACAAYGNALPRRKRAATA